MIKAGIFCLLFLALAQTASAADWVGNLLKVHKEALAEYQKDHDSTKAFIALQHAGVAKAIEQQPQEMNRQAYINLLNDFAYFRYESTAFKTNVPLTVHLKDFSFVGSERMLWYEDIPNATMRLNRLCEAKHILQKVIKLEPERAVSYLNLGDVYWRSAQYAQKIAYSGGRQGNIGDRAMENNQCMNEMKVERFGRVVTDLFADFFNAYDTYKLYQQKMVGQGKADKVPERIRKLTSRKLGYTVAQDNGLELGDHELCIDYEKALNALSDNEIYFLAANYHRGMTNEAYAKKYKEAVKKGLASPKSDSARGDVTRYDPSFKRIPFSSLPVKNQKYLINRKWSFYAPGSEHPVQIFERKGNIYVDTRAAYGLLMIYTDPEVQKSQRMESRRCDYKMLNFEKKMTMSQ